MITGDSNIDLLASSEIQKRYIDVLETYGLKNHINHTNRSNPNWKDTYRPYIISNILANKILHSDALPCPTISDYDNQ